MSDFSLVSPHLRESLLEVDFEEPGVTQLALVERLLHAADTNRHCAASRRREAERHHRDAADALEQAKLHDAHAEAYKALADALANPPEQREEGRDG